MWKGNFAVIFPRPPNSLAFKKAYLPLQTYKIEKKLLKSVRAIR